jgi:predicted hydrolase (HD superfamily)
MKILAWPALGAFALVVACARPSGMNGRTSTESRTLEAGIFRTGSALIDDVNFGWTLAKHRNRERPSDRTTEPSALRDSESPPLLLLKFMSLARADAWALMTEYTQSESLRKHMLAVEAAVRGYARKWGEDEDDWGAVALLHDFDYERWPDAENHPFRGVEILKAKGYPEWFTRAILSHADYSGVPRESRLEHTLYACDEMSGFVTAAALVRPSKSVLDLEASSVIKRMKDKAFARAVNREDLKRGAEELGLPLDEHITNVIAFMREQVDALGLRGNL